MVPKILGGAGGGENPFHKEDGLSVIKWVCQIVRKEVEDSVSQNWHISSAPPLLA